MVWDSVGTEQGFPFAAHKAEAPEAGQQVEALGHGPVDAGCQVGKGFVAANIVAENYLRIARLVGALRVSGARFQENPEAVVRLEVPPSEQPDAVLPLGVAHLVVEGWDELCPFDIVDIALQAHHPVPVQPETDIRVQVDQPIGGFDIGIGDGFPEAGGVVGEPEGATQNELARPGILCEGQAVEEHGGKKECELHGAAVWLLVRLLLANG